MKELLYRGEVFAIVGAAIEVYNQLGNGFLEGVYQDALAVEMDARVIPFSEQVSLNVVYKGKPIRHTYMADFVAYERIIIELKAIKRLGQVEDAQLMHYLKATGLRLGVLINFGAEGKLEWKRIIV